MKKKLKIILPMILMISLIMTVFLTSCSAEQEGNDSVLEIEDGIEPEEGEQEETEGNDLNDIDNEDSEVTEGEPSEPEEELLVEGLAPDFTIPLLTGGEFTRAKP